MNRPELPAAEILACHDLPSAEAAAYARIIAGMARHLEIPDTRTGAGAATEAAPQQNPEASGTAQGRPGDTEGTTA